MPPVRSLLACIIIISKLLHDLYDVSKEKSIFGERLFIYKHTLARAHAHCALKLLNT